MGLFSVIRERRRVRKLFEKYVSPAAIKAIEESSEYGFTSQIEDKHLQFIIVNLQEAPVEEVNATLTRVVDCLFRHNATLFWSSPTLVRGCFGVPSTEHDLPQNRTAAVADLLQENGSRIRLLHGECTAPVGNFGGNFRLCYDMMLPGYTAKLKRLFELEFGTAEEIPA
ncbi:hypothetical protein Acid345_0095 [Candidatus Koribacter versatilis Ellin345]|uniref:Uncharacterized protein n=1 Tax=Koribacter versatilis (strain Ellin345) TaxID=204669 RepID=Q1IVK0_KORVE|nr:hypothetical protein Acid345_0095 [Candidatus Koribacter versatilis Ellin345]